MSKLLRVLFVLLLPAGSAALFALPETPRAGQFVLIDVTFTFTKDDADNSTPSKSHWYCKGDRINPERPKDWTTPVDYRNGTVHIRTEVLEKPEGGQPCPGASAISPTRGRRTATAARTPGSTRRRASSSATSR